ncbi:DNA polymerase alpha subunit B-like [Octopus vulgaris]|uniref:DNA polymerase alpha subunit B n=1 Tax=Octopus vulgaris TaxID=6645 RepID=A0AA36AI82_OCTVU|nr:DNA polymerase alpha subunit B-like [Octopus vulgaris]
METLSEELKSKFQLEDDENDVLDKLYELLHSYKLEVSDLHDHWIAFLMTKKMDLVTKPSLKLASIMQRDVLAKKAIAANNNNNNSSITETESIEDPSGFEDMMSMYNVKTPSSMSKSKKRPRSPDIPKKSLNTSFNALLPELYSPKSATPPRIFKDRTNSGECVLSFGNVTSAPWSDTSLKCSFDLFDTSSVLTNSVKYMFEKKHDQAEYLNEQIDKVSSKLKQKHELERFHHIALSSQETVTIAGRVCCDCESRLNAQSILLEGSHETSSGKTCPIDVTELKDYSLFPGQIVAFDGTNPTGKMFMAKKVYDDVPLQQAPLVPEKLPKGSSLNILIAAGPFLTTDSIMFEPLTDLLNVCQKEKPHMCILIGPFLDEEHTGIQTLKDESYETMFTRVCQGIKEIAEQLRCTMVLVPSARDIHNTPIYPQPPFEYGESEFMHFVTDPSLLSINGVVFGITSTDVIFHICNSECFASTNPMNRFKRIIRHLFSQQSFYPLYPSHNDVSVSFSHAESFELPTKPHVLIVPSQFRYFVVDVDDCCCINPGNLTKREAGGTFALMNIHRSNNDQKSSLISDTAVKIIRV